MKRISDASFRARGSYESSLKADSPPQLDLLEGICRVLNVDAHYLMTGFGPPRPFIPDSVTIGSPKAEMAAAERKAREAGVPEDAIQYVHRTVRPDPRLGSERLLHLFLRAEKFVREREASQRKSRRKKASKRSTSGRAPKTR